MFILGTIENENITSRTYLGDTIFNFLASSDYWIYLWNWTGSGKTIVFDRVWCHISRKRYNQAPYCTRANHFECIFNNSKCLIFDIIVHFMINVLFFYIFVDSASYQRCQSFFWRNSRLFYMKMCFWFVLERTKTNKVKTGSYLPRFKQVGDDYICSSPHQRRKLRW